MNAINSNIKQFLYLRVRPGPKPGWYSKAAGDLGYTRSYISRLTRGLAKSPAAEAALKDWKRKNKITS
jgi:hypothetical protein